MLHDVSAPQKNSTKSIKNSTKQILLQPRDLQILQFVAKFGSVNDRHIMQILNMTNNHNTNNQDQIASPLSFHNYMRIIRRLIASEYLERVKIIANEYGYVMLGNKGEALLNIKRQKKLLLNTLRHDMLTVDLYLDFIGKNPNYVIQCERELKKLHDIKFKDYNNNPRKLPDLLINTHQINEHELSNSNVSSHSIAIEVELTEKEQRRLIAIINNYIYNNPVNEVWYFVISSTLGKKIIELSNNNPKFKIFLIDLNSEQLIYKQIYNNLSKNINNNNELIAFNNNKNTMQNTAQSTTKDLKHESIKIDDGWSFDLDNFLKQSN